MADPRWLDWCVRLQAIAQSGLAYADDPYDAERYSALRRIVAEMLSAQAADQAPALSPDMFDSLLAREQGYATPKLDGRGACFRNGRILLVRERSDGRWTLPGGWIDVGDGPAAAVEREIVEESGYHARAVKLLAVWDKQQHDHPSDFFHIYKLIFLCEIIGGRPTLSAETDGVDFFAPDNLPPLSTSRITAAQIKRIFSLQAQPDAPTDFD